MNGYRTERDCRLALHPLHLSVLHLRTLKTRAAWPEACNVLSSAFIQSIIPSSLSKQNGVRYIRSEKDNFTVKPTLINGKCNELSEHCTEEEAMWYTCLNYMNLKNGGVNVNQVSLLVLNAQDKASKNVLESIKIDSHPLSTSQTEEAIKFKEHFYDKG